MRATVAATSGACRAGGPHDRLEQARRRSLGIDVVKGLAMLGVIAQHVVPSETKFDVGAALWMNQAVPVFILLIGFNSARSLSRGGGRSLRELYTAAYVRSRLRRLVLPVLWVYAVLVVAAIAVGRLNIGGLQLVGAAPLDGGAPGDYFVGLVLSIAVLFPALWWCWLRRPGPTALGAFTVAIAAELVARHLLVGSALAAYVAVANPFRVAATLVIGMWLASQPSMQEAQRRHGGPIVAGAAVSLAYLIALIVARDGRDGFGILYPAFTLSTGVWALGWSTLVTLTVVVAVDRIDHPGVVVVGLKRLGVASYHVFLVQAAVLGLLANERRVVLVVGGLAALPLGCALWWAMEGRTTPAPGGRR